MGLPKLLPALVPERLLERSHGPLPICNQLQSREWAPLWLLLTGQGQHPRSSIMGLIWGRTLIRHKTPPFRTGVGYKTCHQTDVGQMSRARIASQMAHFHNRLMLTSPTSPSPAGQRQHV